MSSSARTAASILAITIGGFAGLALIGVSTTASLVAVGVGAVVALVLVGDPFKREG